MSQSLVQNYLHITFSTKYRLPLIQPSIANELYAYIGGICKEFECHPIEIGGFVDHVHILCMLSKKVALMDLLRLIKCNSSKWIKSFGEKYDGFYWQDGYAAFSVNHKDVKAVADYIQNQEQHHKTQDFQNELRYFLNRYQIKYDERYVWE